MGCYSNILCGMLPPTQLITPAVYDESLSYEEQIAHIFALISQMKNKLDGYVTIEAFDAYAELIKAEQAAQKVEWEKYTDDVAKELLSKFRSEITRLEELIHEITVGNVTVLDPTKGQQKRNADIVIERVYDFDRVFSLPANEYDALKLTCKEWAALEIEAREYDVIAVLLLDQERGING